jgi:sialate O-acetylesterase
MAIMKIFFSFFFYLFFLTALPAHAQVRLPRLVRDSMVLQRDIPVNIWGWARPGEKISIKFNKKTYKTSAANDGQWKLQLAPLKAGGPYTMQIDASNHITLKEILAGDVWVCSGQSNMVHQMNVHRDLYEQDIATANYPQIRQFWIPTMTDLVAPREDLPTGFWRSANPQDLPQFSAVAYFFARHLYEKYHVPIGIINASVGGTPVQAWTSAEGLKDFPDIAATIKKNKDSNYVNGLIRAAAAGNNRPQPEDKGLTGTVKWFETSYVPKGWRPVMVPGYWEDQGIKDLDGIVWYRKEIEVPASFANTPARLVLGRIIDADIAYINGVQVGSAPYQYPQRRYSVPAGLLKAGKNILVVRVVNNAGKGGFVPDKPYCLVAGKDSVDLRGQWQYRVGGAFVPQQPAPAFTITHSPASLYNAMLAPVTRFTIKGFVWYQGETNAGNPNDYARLQSALISDWRRIWAQGELPFFYVQLPNFMEMQYLPAESNWAVLREAQLKTLSVPNTGMAVAIDLGEWNDVHPDRKKEVGDRLALLARQKVYGEKDLVCSGPLYDTAVIEGNRIVISFRETGSGLITNDGESPEQFAIAGADKKFVWAKARIEGNKVIVWSDELKEPKFVRYAWANNPVNPNLFNKEGLPASPFRTDH